MGSLVSPIVANIYMELFEQLALEMALTPPRLWLRYLNNTFTICLQDKIEELTDHITSFDSAIKFTRELETDGEIAFLDSLISLNQDGSLDFLIYRKPTHTNQSLKFSSHHPLHQKTRGRAYSQTSLSYHRHQAARQSDKTRCAGEGTICGYPKWTFTRTAEQTTEMRHNFSEIP